MLKPAFILILILGYFALLVLIAYLTGKQADNQTFFTANRNSPWYLVAFGMVGLLYPVSPLSQYPVG